MALVLGVKENLSFYVADTQVIVTQIITSTKFKITVCAPGMYHVYTITDQRALEILPKVMVSAGSNTSLSMVKVVIEAPRNIKILRDSLYHEENPGT